LILKPFPENNLLKLICGNLKSKHYPRALPVHQFRINLSGCAKLNTNVAIISKTINQGFKMNFNDFINTCIEAIKQAFAAGEHKNYTTRYRF
jgi:hypothetical protein